MKKKILLFVAIVAMLVCLFAISASAVEIGGLHYKLTDSTSVEGYNGTAELTTDNQKVTTAEIVIPASVENEGKVYKVTTFAYRAFKDNKNITSVELPATVEKFNNEVFQNCTNITRVNFNGTLADWCKITFNQGYSNPVYYAKALYINNELLTEVNVPDSVTSIGANAFNSNQAITKITFGNTLTSIGSDAFSGCTSVTEYNYNGTFADWCTKISFGNANSTPTTLLKKLIINGEEITGDLVISEEITKLNKFVFANCPNITSVKLHSGIKSVGENLFLNCTGITSMDLSVLPVKEVATSLFKGCANLAIVTLNSATTKINNSAFEGCTSLKSVDIPSTLTSLGSYAFKKSGIEYMDLSKTTIKSIEQETFNECDSMITIKLPTTLTTIKSCCIANCDKLVFIDFGDNQNTFKFDGWGTLYNNVSLKALSLPKNTTHISDRGIGHAVSLEAVYLGEALIEIKGNKGDSWDNGPAFGNNEKMYFVQEPFSVVKEDGSFFTADEFVQPVKPRVYYFPSTLLRICGTHNRNNKHTIDENGHASNASNDDLAFANCKNLNSVLVFPEGFTGFDDVSNTTNTEQRGDTLYRGLMHNCATAENPLTLVFMGRIDRVSMDRRYGFTNYMTYVFANEANTGFENTTIGSYIGDSGYYSGQEEMYVIFCHAPGGAQKYNIKFTQSEANKDVPVLTPTQIEGVFHVVEDRKTVVTSDATCTVDVLINTFCFCGKAIDTNKEIVGTALGHEYDLAKGAVKSKIEYANYLADGKLFVKCARCTECQENKVNPIITEFKGFSVSEKGDGITFGYTFDKAAISEFEAVNGKIELGFVVAVKAFAGSDAYTSDKAVKAAVTNDEIAYTGADFILRGTWDKMVDLDGDKTAETDVKNVEFYMAGYILVNGAVTYLNNGASGATADTVTFNTCNKQETPEIVE